MSEPFTLRDMDALRAGKYSETSRLHFIKEAVFGRGTEKAHPENYDRARNKFRFQLHQDWGKVPRYSRWLIDSLTFSPAHSVHAKDFKKLCELFPLAYLEIVPINCEAMIQVPLQQFHVSGESHISPRFNCLGLGRVLGQLDVFDAWLFCREKPEDFMEFLASFPHWHTLRLSLAIQENKLI